MNQEQDHVRSLLAATGLPEGPLNTTHTLYKRTRGRKLHRVSDRAHNGTRARTQCGMPLADLDEVQVTFLDGIDPCGKCGDSQLAAAHRWKEALIAVSKAQNLLSRPPSGDAEEVIALRQAVVVLEIASNRLPHRAHGTGANMLEVVEEFNSCRERLAAQAQARLADLVPRLSGRIPVGMRARFAAEQATVTTDGDEGIPAPWAGEYAAAAEVWCNAHRNGTLGPKVAGSTVDLVAEQLARPSTRSDAALLVTEPTMSGGRFQTPAEWARAELEEGAKRYALHLTCHWDARTRELLATAEGPLRYVAFDGVVAAMVERFAAEWPYCLERQPEVIIFASAPVAFTEQAAGSGIVAVDPLAAAWLSTRPWSQLFGETHDLGPVVTDGDDGRHRHLVMAEFARRWNPYRYSDFCDPHEVLALARAVVAD